METIDELLRHSVISVKKMADDIRLYESGSSQTIQSLKNNSYMTDIDDVIIDQINFDAEKDNFTRVSRRY